MSIDRKTAIDILKNGLRFTRSHTEKDWIIYPSFGQLDPEIQAVASGIKPEEFYRHCDDNQWSNWSNQPLRNDCVYKLSPNYIDPPVPLTPEAIIKYLEDSTVAPGEWPEEVKRYALEIEKYGLKESKRLFEFRKGEQWTDTYAISLSGNSNLNSLSRHPHRLRKGVWPVKTEEFEYLEIIKVKIRLARGWYEACQVTEGITVRAAESFVDFKGYAVTANQKYEICGFSREREIDYGQSIIRQRNSYKS